MESRQPAVYMGVGIPGSGKSTYLAGFARERGFKYLSSDELRKMLTGSESDHSQDKAVWERHDEIVAEALGDGRSIVLDSTNTVRDRRVRDVRRYRKMGAVRVVALVFDVPFSVAIKRNRERGSRGGREVPAHAIKLMHGRLRREPIACTEGFDDIIFPKRRRRTA